MLGRIDRWLSVATLGAVTILLILCVTVSVALLAGLLNWPFVLLLAIPLSVAVMFIIVQLHKKYESVLLPSRYTKERVVCTAALLVLIVAWGLVNVRFTAEHILVNRDPGVYTLGAIHLSKNENLNVSSDNIFGGKASVASSGIGLSEIDHRYLYFQGLHLLPALLGLGGKIIGSLNVFHLNIIFGMSTLLAIFLFTVRFVRPFWALVASGLLSVSMPLLYFSRDIYTEPLAATLTFTGLTMLWIAVETRQKSIWLLAGLAIGAATLTRIDGYLAIAAALFFIAFYAAFTAKGARRRVISEVLLFALGATITALLGWLDLLLLSSGYFFDLMGKFKLEIVAIVLMLIATVALCGVMWRTKWWITIDNRLRKRYISIATLGVLGLVLLLGTRQFWNQPVSSRGRTFDELAPLWPGWYLGEFIVGAAVIGIVIILYKLIKQRKIAYLIPLSVILLTSIVYLIKPSIAPDQVWAARRLLPVILPGLVFFAVVAFAAGFDHVFKKIPFAPTVRGAVLGLSVCILAIEPLSVSKPMALKAQEKHLAIITQFCERLPQRAAVVWIGTAKGWAPQATKEVCNVPSAGLSTQFVDTAELATIENNLDAKGYVLVLAIFGDDYNPAQSLVRSERYKVVLTEEEKPAFSRLSVSAYNALDKPTRTAPTVMTTPVIEVYAAQVSDGKIITLQNGHK